MCVKQFYQQHRIAFGVPKLVAQLPDRYGTTVGDVRAVCGLVTRDFRIIDAELITSPFVLLPMCGKLLFLVLESN